MKFSIIVPVYNVEKYLPQCIDSILNQDYVDFELILVNDGSPDNSLSICCQYAEKDKRVRVINKPNGGSTSSRKAGAKIAKGECRMCGAAVPQAPVLTAPASFAGSSITAAMGGAWGVQQPTVYAESAAMFLLRMHSLVT